MPPLPKKVSNSAPYTVPPPAPTKRPVRTARPIRVEVKRDGKDVWHTVQALVMGSLGVHPSLEGNPKGWTVTSVTVGLIVTMVDTEADAVKIAEYLALRFDDHFCQETAEEIHGHVPTWVKLWLRSCTRQRKWVEPHKYEKEYS